MMARAAIALLATLALTPAGRAAEPAGPAGAPEVTVSEIGLLHRERELPNTDPRAMTLVRATDRVEACIGIDFGYRVDVRGLAPGAHATLSKVVTTPPLQKPDGTVSQGYTRDFDVEVPADGVITAYEGYGFDHEWETVPGAWTIELQLDGKKIARQTFLVVACAQPPAKP